MSTASATLTILGGGGWLPAHGRHTATALLRDGDTAILIDAGTGVCRLIEQPELIEGVVRMDIVLTHFHLDHVAGLAYLPALGLCEQTTIWGPGRLLYDTPTVTVLDRVSREPFHPVPLEQQDIEVRDVPASGELELAGVRVYTRPQTRHSAPTLGLRFDDRLAWITDTAHDPGSASFASGCGLLAHEAWFTSSRPRNADIHSSAAEAAAVALDAGIDGLLLIHLPPFRVSVEELRAEAEEHLPGAFVASEGLSVSSHG